MTNEERNVLAEALAGTMAVAALNGAYFDEEHRAWAHGILAGKPNPPIVALQKSIAFLSGSKSDDTRDYSPFVIQLAIVSPSLGVWADAEVRGGADENEIKRRILSAMAIVEPERAVIGNAGDYVVACRHAITPEEIGFLLVGEFEGNPMASWIGKVRPDRPAVAVPASLKSDPIWYDDEAFISSPDFRFTITHDDPETGDDGEHSKTTVVDRAAIVKGLELMAAKSPAHWADLISESSADAITYDVAMQYIVLGEVVYG